MRPRLTSASTDVGRTRSASLMRATPAAKLPRCASMTPSMCKRIELPPVGLQHELIKSLGLRDIAGLVCGEGAREVLLRSRGGAFHGRVIRTLSHFRRRWNCGSAGALAEQHGAHFRIAHVDRGRRFDADGEGALDRGSRADGLEPALEMREVAEVLALPLG